MDDAERKLWLDAAKALGSDPAARVPCPACGHAPLAVEDVQAFAGHMGRRIHCLACGRGESMLMKVAHFNEGARVELFAAHPDLPLPVGSKGVVYRIHDGRPARYEIGFAGGVGGPILVAGVPETHLALQREPRPDDHARPFVERALSFIIGSGAGKPPSPPAPPRLREAEAVTLAHALVGVPHPGGTPGTIRRARPGNPPIYLVQFAPDDGDLHEIEEIYLIPVRPPS